ncbi:hypothetical protein M011DRAFT_470753 [Sporormia fimetaria CBS 119925]|uniref:DUF7707 domain-containing protein n=1 Tax=Sporormia fimetaria CBS 119925 TaxID=1340428 RepID=A0A6A6V3C6_9PLEO|nr:hypothetical protein M011DRAFT_470753 [Sporormia fimetaria CBS 119925]
MPHSTSVHAPDRRSPGRSHVPTRRLLTLLVQALILRRFRNSAMLFTAVLAAAATFTSFAVAQNETSNLPPGFPPCCSLDPNTIELEQRQEWCRAQRNTCPELCGGINQLDRAGQTCDINTLEYTCKCANGTEPDMAKYQQSVPGLMCFKWYDNCIAASGEDLEFQTQCLNLREERCGNMTTKEPEDDSEPSPSESASPSATSGGDSEESAAPSDDAQASPAPSGAASALVISTPLFVGGIAALFGLAL